MIQWMNAVVERTVKSYAKRAWIQCASIVAPQCASDYIDRLFEEWWGQRSTHAETKAIGEIMRAEGKRSIGEPVSTGVNTHPFS